MKKFIIPAVAVVVLAAVAVVAAVLLNTHKEEYRLIKVNNLKGVVSVEREKDGLLDAFKGMKLISGDEVKVKENSFLELLADSDKHIGAEENTSFVLKSSGNEENGYLTIELLYGKGLFTIDNKLGENSFFDVKTPNATLSVRGTSFSVEYNREMNETVVEVFEGTVWASYYGKEQTLEKGDIIRIKPDSEEQTNKPTPDNGQTPTAPTESVDFMISRYFRNVPDYITVPAEKLEFYYQSDLSQAAAVVSTTNSNVPTVNPALSESLKNINEDFIDTVIDKIAEETNKAMTKDYLNSLASGRMLETDITDWYKDFASRTVVITDTDIEYRFNFQKVTLDWIYADMTEEYANENCGYLPLSDVDAEGRVYGVVGIIISFSA